MRAIFTRHVHGGWVGDCSTAHKALPGADRHVLVIVDTVNAIDSGYGVDICIRPMLAVCIARSADGKSMKRCLIEQYKRYLAQSKSFEQNQVNLCFDCIECNCTRWLPLYPSFRAFVIMNGLVD